MPRLGALAVASVLGCGAESTDAAARTWTPLVPAIDLDPDPDVVEIELVAEVAALELLPGTSTEVWAYRDAGDPDGVARVPGPLVDVALGDRLIVHLTNELPETTTLHWHGLRVPEAMDGNPMAGGSVAPGERATVDFVVRDPGLHWFHSHRAADVQTQRGLQGAVVVRDPSEPNDGSHERVLVLDDLGLAADGDVLLEPSAEDIMLGRRGNVLLVNGRLPGTASATAGTLERWRVVNTSNGRTFVLALAGTPATSRALVVTGGDNGPVAEPYAVDALVVAPGERYDVRVAIGGAPGDVIELQTLAYDRGGGMADPGPYTLMSLELDGAAATAPRIDAPARTIERLVPDVARAPRRFTLQHELGEAVGAVFTIDGKRWPLAPPLHVEHGATELWELVNETEHDHPFHLHGYPFQVLDRDGVAEPTLGWKDTVRVSPRGVTRIAVRHEALGMWMFHCSIPEHAERGMMLDVHVMEAP